jgi:hypothetical protein
MYVLKFLDLTLICAAWAYMTADTDQVQYLKLKIAQSKNVLVQGFHQLKVILEDFFVRKYEEPHVYGGYFVYSSLLEV